MADVYVNGLTLKNIKVNEIGGYSGLDVEFTINGLLYNFMIAKREQFFPLNILHKFKEQDVCPLCKRRIYPFPIGQQPCLELKKIDRLLLERLNKFLPKI
ncbi:hypothetical protein [Neobacillus cucumis]|uniref:hypothetical protein n=1 Tax=Neobacillus cucumis TaxID=1740721 RepID=UPI002E1DDEBE|nr:hypothetical protein [Neobacillus cucumis]